MAFRGVDLGDLYRGTLTYRKLGVLLAALPFESAFKTAVRNDQIVDEDAPEPDPEAAARAQWSRVEMLLAAISDGVSVLAWQQGQIHGGSKSPAPAPIPRPGVVVRSASGIGNKAHEYLANLQNKRRGLS